MAPSNLTIRVRLVGKVYHVEPWRLAPPALGERVWVDPSDLRAVVATMAAGKGRPTRIVVRLEG